MPAEAGSYYLTGDVELSGAWNVTGTLIEPITGEYGSKVTAPENPTKPGYVFKGCAQLEKLRLPKDCAIDETAFDGCKALAIYAPAGGTVEDFCEAQGISFVPETAKETRKTLC